jgi:amino acid permease
MSDEDFDAFPNREELLGGLPAKRADTLLFLIESRTAHLVAQSRRAMERFLTEDNESDRELAFFEAFSQGREPPLSPTVQDIEHYAGRWAPLIAKNPSVQAALAHRLGQKYRFTYEAVPGTRAAVGLDNPDVRRAYRRLYAQPLEEIFASRASPYDRLRWGWATLRARLERLSPFWTAYSLTLTETVGATILALPIALATIGPLAGVLILVVLGAVNIVTVAYMAEAVVRSGTIRHGGAYMGRVVEDYLGTAGSLILSVGFFVLCLLILLVFYIGVSTTLEDVSRAPAPGWVAFLFLVGLYYMRRESLNATVASALVVGAANIGLVVILSVLALTHMRGDNLLYANVPFISGGSFDPSIVELVFGVVLAAYFGHASVSLCGRLVLRRDPSGRSLMWGCVAAQATAVFLYSLFVLGVSGAVAPSILAGESGTVLSPLAREVGPVVTVLGTVFVILGMGMGSIHFTLALSGLTLERLPSESTPIVLLPRRRARLLFDERPRRRAKDGLRIGVVYLGMRGGAPEFRLEVEMNGRSFMEETTPGGVWEILLPTAPSPLFNEFPSLRGRGHRLAIEVVEATRQSARLRVSSSLRVETEGQWDTVGLSAAGVLLLADPEADLVVWMMRQGEVSLQDAAAYTGEEEHAIRSKLETLMEQGLVQEVSDEGGPMYATRMGARRGREVPAGIWRALAGDAESRLEFPNPTPKSVGPQGARSLFFGKRGRFFLGALPVFVAFAITEWMLLTDSGSYAGLLGFVGTIVVSLVAGIFPVLLLIASRRKGEHVPATASRFLGHPLLLGAIFLLFLFSILLHGLVIWEAPLLRGGALFVGAAIVVMTIVMARTGSFARRLTIDVREDHGRGRTFFAVTARGRESKSEVLLEYGDVTRKLHTATGEIPEFPSLRRAVFQPTLSDGGAIAPRELKVRVQRITEEGDSEAMSGVVRVQVAGETKSFNLALSNGQVLLPLPDTTCRVTIEPTEAE